MGVSIVPVSQGRYLVRHSLRDLCASRAAGVVAMSVGGVFVFAGPFLGLAPQKKPCSWWGAAGILVYGILVFGIGLYTVLLRRKVVLDTTRRLVEFHSGIVVYCRLVECSFDEIASVCVVRRQGARRCFHEVVLQLIAPWERLVVEEFFGGEDKDEDEAHQFARAVAELCGLPHSPETVAPD